MEDIVVKVSGRDVYKAVKQYLNNGLGLTKEEVQAQIKEKAESWARDHLVKEQVERIIKEQVNKTMHAAVLSATGYPDYYPLNTKAALKEYITKKIEGEITKVAAEITKDAVQAFLNAGKKE